MSLKLQYVKVVLNLILVRFIFIVLISFETTFQKSEVFSSEFDRSFEDDPDDLSDADGTVVDDEESSFLALIDESLSLNQSEILSQKSSDVRLNLGPVYPWQDLGLASVWKIDSRRYVGLGIGRGNFILHEKIDEIDFKIDSDIESLYASYLYYFENLPLVFTVFAGINIWSGRIRPLGYDFAEDSNSASLVSDFSNVSVSVGSKISYFWHWNNHLGVEVSVVDVSSGHFIKEAYTSNIAIARKSLRKSLQGPNFFLGLQLAVSYWFSDENDL